MHTAQTSSPTKQLRVAIVGGGWAGLAAAVYATQAGHSVSVFEAAHQWGGRARSVTLPWPDAQGQPQPLDLDNGQHILIGAYSASFALMRQVGADPAQAFARLPLALKFADGSGLALPDWTGPVPGLDAAWGMLRAKGWRWADKLALLRASRRWQAMGYQCPADWTVARLCQGLSPQLMAEFIDPLCVSALNTLSHEASGQVFLRVLHDSLMGPRVDGVAPSNLMLPRQTMGALWCEQSARWLAARGAQLHLGHTVQALRAETGQPGQATNRVKCGEDARHAPLLWHLHTNGDPLARTAAMNFDRVLIATNAGPAARLLGALQLQALPTAAQAALQDDAQRWCSTAEALRWEAISTVYARVTVQKQATDAAYHLRHPMLALRATAAHPAQFVFERDQLHGLWRDHRPAGSGQTSAGAASDAPDASAGLARTHALAFVVSASRLDRNTLAQAVTAQALAELGLQVQVQHVLTDKRATFCCTPGLQRPPMAIAPRSASGLLACGDHVDGPYPATLEGAVRSALAAVQAMTEPGATARLS